VPTLGTTAGKTSRRRFVFELGIEILILRTGLNHRGGRRSRPGINAASRRITGRAGNHTAIHRNGLLFGDIQRRTTEWRYFCRTAGSGDDDITFKYWTARGETSDLSFSIAGENLALRRTDDTNLSSHDCLHMENGHTNVRLCAHYSDSVWPVYWT
jgi:hypothetical protein